MYYSISGVGAAAHTMARVVAQPVRLSHGRRPFRIKLPVPFVLRSKLVAAKVTPYLFLLVVAV